MVPEAHQVGAFLILFKAPLEGGGGVLGGYLGNLVPRALSLSLRWGWKCPYPPPKLGKSALRRGWYLG